MLDQENCCKGCEFMELEHPTSQHCYMFSVKPKPCSLNLPDKELHIVAQRVIEGGMSLTDAMKNL